MDILIGLLIIAIGSFCQSSSYVPIKKVKEWSWESFWLIQGVFAWLVFPFLGSLLGVQTDMVLCLGTARRKLSFAHPQPSRIAKQQRESAPVAENNH